MNNLINKEYALQTLFADEPKNWMRQAIGFNYVAKVKCTQRQDQPLNKL